MGSRDYQHRESKKPKKSTKKVSVTILPPLADVEVVKKRKKKREEEEASER